MNSVQKRDILKTENGWGLCPVCGRKLMHVRPDTIAENLEIYCKGCHSSSIVNIVQSQSLRARAD